MRVESIAKANGFEFGTPPSFPEGIALHCFVEGSRVNIKRYLLEHEEEYSTLKEAYKVAKRYESIENAVLEEKQEFLSAAVGFGMRMTG